MCLSFCLFICLFVYLFICLFVYLFICLIVYLFICLFVYLFICLFVYLFICLFVYLFICLFAYLFIRLFIHLFFFSYLILFWRPTHGRRSTRQQASISNDHLDENTGLHKLRTAHAQGDEKFKEMENFHALHTPVRLGLVFSSDASISASNIRRRSNVLIITAFC